MGSYNMIVFFSFLPSAWAGVESLLRLAYWQSHKNLKAKSLETWKVWAWAKSTIHSVLLWIRIAFAYIVKYSIAVGRELASIKGGYEEQVVFQIERLVIWFQAETRVQVSLDKTPNPHVN